jgi:hypothetical protein
MYLNTTNGDVYQWSGSAKGWELKMGGGGSGDEKE